MAEKKGKEKEKTRNIQMFQDAVQDPTQRLLDTSLDTSLKCPLTLTLSKSASQFVFFFFLAAFCRVLRLGFISSVPG